MGYLTKITQLRNCLILFVLLIGISSLISFSIIPEAFSQTTIPLHKPDGIVRQYDDRIYIVQHTGYSMLEGVEGRFVADSIIYGDIVNLSDDTVYYIIMRGNVYKDQKLWEKTGYQQAYTFRFDYPPQAANPTELAISPYKSTLKPGEASPFALWPGQVGWDCYEIWVESYEFENKADDITDERMRNDIVIKSVKVDNSGTYKGKVFNPTEKKVDEVTVILLKYDSNDRIFAVLGDRVGVLSPNKAKSFTIPAYTPGYPITTHTDNFIYGEPTRVEVLAWGYSPYRGQDYQEDYDDKHSAKLFAESPYYPNSPLPQYMNLEEIKHKAKQDREKPINTNFCLGGEEKTIMPGQTKPIAEVPESKILTAKTRIPDWIRNNAKWWADGAIAEQDFVSGIQYLIKQGIMRVPTTAVLASEDETKNKAITDQGYLEVNGREFFVSRYNPATLTITGKVDDDRPIMSLECDLSKPGEYYDDSIFIAVKRDGTFDHPMIFTNDNKEGEYNLDCKYKHKDSGSLSFSLTKSSEKKPAEKELKPEKNVPEWIKNNADWWSQGLISDDDFVKGIQYLVEQGIIKI